MPSYVITGANRGIGFEFVKQLSAHADNTVFGVVRNRSKSQELIALQSSRSNLHVLVGDLTDVKSLKNAASEVSKVTGGTLDVLINNASFIPSDLGHTIDGYPEGQEAELEQEYVDIFRINVVGTIHATNAFLPLILAASAKKTDFTPKVITLTTAVADADFTLAGGWHLSASYSISKAAQNSVVAKYAATHEKDNVIFLAISPGLVDTFTAKSPPPEVMEEVLKMFVAFKRAAPNWDSKPYTPEDAVSKMLNVFAKLTKRDNGAFVSQFGNKQWL